MSSPPSPPGFPSPPNVSRIKEFQAFYGEMKKRAAKLAADAGTGNLQKTSLSYGRVLDACVSCYATFRDWSFVVHLKRGGAARRTVPPTLLIDYFTV